MITKQQHRRLRQEYARTQNMSLSALKADVDRKTARKYIDHHETPQELQEPHDWRTRADPLVAVWPQAASLLAEVPELEAKTLFEYFLTQAGSGLEACHLRTFQRRVQHWRGTHGPEQDVMFDQRRQPGELMEMDWTHPGELEVTVQGQPLEHLLCHGVLAYSNWQWASRCQSESFLSLVAGLQACLGKLGKVPRHLATDNSSAATHEIESGKRSFNPEYLDLCEHYDVLPLTINVGCPNEQGDLESANRHLKRRMEQHLLLRGSRDFTSAAAYDGFVGGIMEAANGRRQRHVEEELAVMRAIASDAFGGVPGTAGAGEFQQHDPGAEHQLFGAVPPGWAVGAGGTIRGGVAGVPRAGGGGDTATAEGGPRCSNRLPTRCRPLAAQTRGLPKLPAPGAVVPQSGVPRGVRSVGGGLRPSGGRH